MVLLFLGISVVTKKTNIWVICSAYPNVMQASGHKLTEKGDTFSSNAIEIIERLKICRALLGTYKVTWPDAKIQQTQKKSADV
jgi:hypothetical protein